MADKDLYLSDSPNVSKGRVEQDGQLRGVLLQAVPSGDLQLSDSPNVDTGYITDTDGKKHKVNLVAEVEGDLEFPDSENSTTGYVTDGDGKKHRVNLTATLYGGGSDPVIAELNVTPTTSAQLITAPEGTDGYSPVNVSAVTASIDANIQAGNIKKDVTILGVTGTYEASAGGKYQLFQRIKDDSNNEIGTVCGFHKDSSNNEYAVVCLDAQYRADSLKILNTQNTNVTTLTQYATQAVYTSTETATENTTKILNYATSISDTSPAAEHARSKTFTIENQVYAGQIPVYIEVLMICVFSSQINALDPTASSYSGLIIPTGKTIASVTTKNGYGYWNVQSDGRIANTSAWSSAGCLFPVLELPNA